MDAACRIANVGCFALGDTEQWRGHKIKIWCAPTRFQGNAVDGIRVEPIVPKPALKDDLNDGINF